MHHICCRESLPAHRGGSRGNAFRFSKHPRKMDRQPAMSTARFFREKTSQAVWDEQPLAHRMALIRTSSGIFPQAVDLMLPSCQTPRQAVTKRKAPISAAPAPTYSSSRTGPLCKLRHIPELRHHCFPRHHVAFGAPEFLCHCPGQGLIWSPPFRPRASLK